MDTAVYTGLLGDNMVLFPSFSPLLAFLPVLLAVLNTYIAGTILYNMYIRSSCWTVLNQGTVITLLDFLIIQNLALYEVFLMLINDKGETQDFRGCMNFIGLEFVYGIFLMYPAFFSLFVRLFLIKYSESLMVEGTGLLKFLFLFCSLLFSTWLSSFFFLDKGYPTNYFQIDLCVGGDTVNKEIPAYFAGRLKVIAFISFFLVGIISTHYRVHGLQKEAFKGSLRKVGIRYGRNILSFRQSVIFVYVLCLIRVGRELVLLFLYVNRIEWNKDAMEVFLVFYFIKEAVLSGYLASIYFSTKTGRKGYFELYSERNIDNEFGILEALSAVQYCFPKQSSTMYTK